MSVKDVVIIGAGPSGVATAIQLKRYRVEPVLLEKEEIGGLLRNADLVENYPGFPDGIPGYELVKLFEKQLENFGVRVHFEEVLKLDYRNKMFTVKTSQRAITCRIIVIASGTKPRRFAISDMPADTENRIFYEVYPIGEVANEKIAIVGSGDIAFDYALNLSKKNEVMVLNRGKKVKCLPLLWERAVRSEKISYKENTRVKKIRSRDDGLILNCHNPMGVWEIYARYLIVAIGREPCLDFLSENLKKSLEKLRRAKVLHMIGDVRNDIRRQIAISVGNGIEAAMEVYRKISEEAL